MCNADVRTAAKSAGVFLWEVAEEIGISEPTMTRRLRRELPESEKKSLFDIIKRLSEMKKNTSDADSK